MAITFPAYERIYDVNISKICFNQVKDASFLILRSTSVFCISIYPPVSTISATKDNHLEDIL